MRMNDIIYKKAMHDPNIFGEALREFCFKESRGCYSCFELVDGFEEMKDSEAQEFVEKILTSDQWWGPYFEKNIVDTDWGVGIAIYDKYQRNCYINRREGIKIAWFWDGDGDLSIECSGKLVINGDCKKDYVWEFATWKDRNGN